MDRATETKRQVLLIAIEKGVERLRQQFRDASPEAIDDLYGALRIAPGKMVITVEPPTGKDLL